MIHVPFPSFSLDWDRPHGTVCTRYPDGTCSASYCVWEDDYHGMLLGMSREEHRLHHELAHHLVGGCAPDAEAGGCAIVWRDAHGQPQPQPEAGQREWLIMALQYHSRGLSANLPSLAPLAAWGADPRELSAELARLFWLAQHVPNEARLPVRKPLVTEGVREVVLPGINSNQKAA